MKIFVLDDNEDELEILCRNLEKEIKANILLFSSHHEFMNGLDNSVDLIIMDHKVPPTDGLELMPRIKVKNANCFIIILSGDERGRIIIGYLNAGADRYVMKYSKGAGAELIRFVKEGMEKMESFNNLKRLADGR